MEVVQIDRTIKSASELLTEIEESEVVAVVAPLNLQVEFLRLAGERPVIICKNERILLDEGRKVQFKHAGWFLVKKLEVLIEPLKT